jgi:hypothetical protein
MRLTIFGGCLGQSWGGWKNEQYLGSFHHDSTLNSLEHGYEWLNPGLIHCPTPFVAILRSVKVNVQAVDQPALCKTQSRGHRLLGGGLLPSWPRVDRVLVDSLSVDLPPQLSVILPSEQTGVKPLWNTWNTWNHWRSGAVLDGSYKSLLLISWSPSFFLHPHPQPRLL